MGCWDIVMCSREEKSQASMHASYAGCKNNPTTQHRGRNTKGLFTLTANSSHKATRSHLFLMKVDDLR